MVQFVIPPQAHLTLRRGTLWKYKSLQGDGMSHIEEIIRDSRIYMPRPSQLNDREECKPTFFIGDIHDAAYRPKVEAWVRRAISQRYPPPSEDVILNELAGLRQDVLEGMVRETTKQYAEEVDRQYRILSLADSGKNDHLWRSYADQYTGVCFGFFVNPVFGTAFQVRYVDDFEPLDITQDEGFEALIWTGLVKRTKWSPEREFRLIVREPALPGDAPLVDQKLAFPREQLTMIILGHAMDHERKRRLIELLNAYSPHTKICETRRASPGP